jgi:hypothetical protein
MGYTSEPSAPLGFYPITLDSPFYSSKFSFSSLAEIFQNFPLWTESEIFNMRRQSGQFMWGSGQLQMIVDNPKASRALS